MFCFDIETLSTESNSVVLSAAIIHFDPESDFTYQELLDEALFVKFSVKEQVQQYGRILDQDTIGWWKNQSEEAKIKSYKPSSKDCTLVDGITQLTAYIDKYDKERKKTIWARGSLDQLCIDSLAKSGKLKTISEYYVWRDVRTAIECLKDTAKNGYCKVEKEGYDAWKDVIKHDPVHDCASDIMQLVYGV